LIRKLGGGPYKDCLYMIKWALWTEYVETCPHCGTQVRYDDDDYVTQPTLILKFDPIDRIDHETRQGGICFTEVHRCECGNLFLVDDVCYSLEELSSQNG